MILIKFIQLVCLLVLVSFQFVNTSGYTHTGNPTASGRWPIAGRTVSADHLPSGTHVIINNHEYVVEDRFGGGYTDRVDIFFDTADEAWDFGRQWLVMQILEE